MMIMIKKSDNAVFIITIIKKLISDKISNPKPQVSSLFTIQEGGRGGEFRTGERRKLKLLVFWEIFSIFIKQIISSSKKIIE